MRRYQRTLENFGYLIQQATVFGQRMSRRLRERRRCDLYLYTGCRILCRTVPRSPPRLPCQYGIDTRLPARA